MSALVAAILAPTRMKAPVVPPAWSVMLPVVEVMPLPVTVMAPLMVSMRTFPVPAWARRVIVSASASRIATAPDVLLMRSSEPTWVSRAPLAPTPMPVAARRTSLALGAEMSKSPSPPSMIAPFVDVMLKSLALVVRS